MLPPYDPWLTGTVSLDVVLAARGSAASLATRRRQRLGALLAAAQRHSPMYRRLLAGRDPDEVRLQELPVVGKAGLMAAFDDWIGDPAVHLDALVRFMSEPKRIGEPFEGRYVVWETSGSSGEPGIFVQDAGAMAVYDALEALRRPAARSAPHWLDPWRLGDGMVFVGATGGHFASNVSIERLKRLNPFLATRLQTVSFLQPLAHVVSALESLAPTVLATYPSAAVLLAEEKVAGRLRIAPREIWTGGETLTPAMRRVVQNAFGCVVVNSYGASEFLALATECAEGRMHLNSDWAILEPVDAEGRAVGTGECATTLLTNLANHVQPLIRYDLGDRVRLHSAACPCGAHLPVIEVEGRCDDILRLRARGGAAVSVLPLALSTVLEENARLYDFQLVQRGPAALELRTGQRGADAEAAMRKGRAALSVYLAAQGAPGVQIACCPDKPLTCGRTGKIRRVVAWDGAKA